MRRPRDAWPRPRDATVAAPPRSRTPVLPTGRGGVDWPTLPRAPPATASPRRPASAPTGRRGLPVVWQTEVGEGYSMGSVAAGRFFLFDHAGGRHRLERSMPGAARSCGPRPTPAATRTSTATAPGPGRARSWTGTGSTPTASRGGSAAIARATESSLWEVDTSARFGVVQNFFGVGSTPVVEGELLIVMVGGSPRGSPSMQLGDGSQGNGTGLVAFDKTSGEVRWTLSDELASYSTPRVVTMSGRRRGFAFTRGGLLGFDPIRGSREFFFPWRARRLESVNAATPVVVDDTVFISETYGPGSVLLKVPPNGRARGRVARRPAEPEPAGPLEHARLPPGPPVRLERPRQRRRRAALRGLRDRQGEVESSRASAAHAPAGGRPPRRPDRVRPAPAGPRPTRSASTW